MLQYFDEMKELVNKFGLTRDEMMIVGSGAVTVYGGRQNNDLEFCVYGSGYNKLPYRARIATFFVDHYDLSDNIDLFKDRYLRIGISDNDIFNNQWQKIYNGYYIVIPEIEIAYKMSRMMGKDIADLEYLKTSSISNSFDWELVEKISNQAIKNRKYLVFREYCWQIRRIILKTCRLHKGNK